MEIDKTTKLSHLNVVIDDDSKYLNKLREKAEEDNQNDEDGIKFLALTHEGHTQDTDEIYYEDGKLHYSGSLMSKEGSTYVSFELPLSQDILFDILGESIKRFNKIRTVLEATK